MSSVNPEICRPLNGWNKFNFDARYKPSISKPNVALNLKPFGVNVW